MATEERQTMIDRRKFLITGGASLIALPQLVALPHVRALAGEASKSAPRFVSAARLADGSYAVVVVTADGVIEQQMPLGGRGHDIAQSPDGRLAVAFARRPGTFAVAFDLSGKMPPHVFTSREDRHFYGHGVFSSNGRLLYATENDFDAARGVLGVYDVEAGMRRLGELDTHGIGPHDVVLMPDEATLCVANGGIETHPASGRAKLNLDTMQPSLVFIDRRTGDLLARHELHSDAHQLSIRHLCVVGTGAVWFGGQWEGSVEAAPWLIGCARCDKPIRFATPAATAGPGLKGYIGSVSSAAAGRLVVASAPRAGRILMIDAETGELAREARLADGCGVAPVGSRDVLISSGFGVLHVDAADGRHCDVTVSGVAFDNHLRQLVI